MSYGYVYMGPTPPEENCTSICDPNYAEKSRSECNRFIVLLNKVFVAAHGREPKCKLMIKREQHEFGTNFDVVARFDAHDMGDEMNDAFWFDQNCPATWEPLKGTNE